MQVRVRAGILGDAEARINDMFECRYSELFKPHESNSQEMAHLNMMASQYCQAADLPSLSMVAHDFGKLAQKAIIQNENANNLLNICALMIRDASSCTKCVINCMWALSICFVNQRDWFLSVLSIEDVCLLMKEIELIDTGLIKTANNLLANFSSSKEGRDIVIDAFGIENVFRFASSLPFAKETEHLLHNIFRFELSREIVLSLFGFLVSFQNPKLVLNCASISASYLSKFSQIAKTSGLLSFALSHLRNETNKSIMSSCARFLGQTRMMKIDDAIAILIQNEINFDDELASAVLWSLYRSFPFDIEQAFLLNLPGYLFNVLRLGNYNTQKYAVLCLSLIACNCGEYINILREMNIVAAIAPFAKMDSDAISTSLILQAIIECNGADEAEDLLGEPISEIIETEDEQLYSVAALFIEQLTC